MSEFSYKSSGVDVAKGQRFVESIKSTATNTHNDQVLGGIGGFAGLFAMPQDVEEPVLVACTDGVGTKLLLAQAWQQCEGLGQDLVAMCVNDLVTNGARPLFFLDYLATGVLDEAEAGAVVSSIASACQMSDMALLGGETAEMPGLYAPGHFDLAGFSVGVISKKALRQHRQAQVGDVLIAIPSSGFHANGYSLIRKVIDAKSIDRHTKIGDETLQQCLLKPTKIYVGVMRALYEQGVVQAAAHITGGGFYENIPRMLSAETAAHIEDLPLPAWLQWIMSASGLSLQEALGTFNGGVGMVLAVNPQDVEQVLSICQSHQEPAWVLGEVRAQTGADRVVMDVG